MAAPKKNSRLSPSRHFNFLTNPIVAATADETSYRTELASFVAFENDLLFEKLWPRVLSQPRARAALNCYATKLEDFATRPFIRSRVLPLRLLSFYKGILLRDSANIERFARLRDCFERALILNDLDNAQLILNECNELFGESLWFFRSSALLHSQSGNLEKINNFVDEIKARGGELLVSTILNYFQLLSDSGNAWLHLNNTIHQTINEFDTANYSEGADLISLLFSPNPLRDNRSYVSCISILQAFPIIDIYHFFLKIGQAAAVETVCDTPKDQSNDELTKLILALSEKIDDLQLRRIASLISGNIIVETSTTGALILEYYEAGRYELVTKAFEENLHDLVNPLAYANVVAKSHAYLQTKHSLDDTSIIGQLLLSLRAIYLVTGSTQPHEETICSIAVRLNGLFIAAHVQMALYLALPQKFSDDKTKRCSALSIVTSPESTPMVSAIWAPIYSIFGEKFGLKSGLHFPKYRLKKREICSLINQGADDLAIENAFKSLKSSAPLPKEYFELYSDFCIQTEKIQALLAEAATSLSLNPNYESCFPLARMVDLMIERRIAVSLDYLIVLFFYSKFISTDRDSFLNEVVEEYLSEHDAIPPSKLLSKKISLEPIEIVLFRDVCRQDVMDFLTCFSTVNELRSERVTILELLNELRVIDSDFRMREVEEIISQVIVDSASSKFNSAKIYVDEAAIRNKYRDFISSLVALYGNAKDDGKDRHILWDSGSEESGKALAYLSGDKNAILLRLINTLTDAFLFDEKFGLAKNLSTEIRHGFFTNLLKARLEERFLLSERDSDDHYMTSPYWRDRNHLVPSSVWSEVVHALNIFSARFYELITTAEEWMNIVQIESQSDRVFSYEIGIEDAATIRNELEAHPDAGHVAAFVLNFLWVETEKHLTTMRDKLNGEFRDRLDLLFSDLLQTIGDAKGSIPLVDLTAAITTTREEIKNDVTTAAEWFRRAADPSLGDHSLDYVFQIAIRSFEEVNRGRSAIDLNLPPSFRSITVRGDAVKAFVVAIINLIDNCYKHSGHGSITSVSIHGEKRAGGATIAISNTLSESRRIIDPKQKTNDLRIKLEAGRQLMKAEGGSGLGKANYQIASISSGSGVDVILSERNFRAVISYEH